LLDDAILDADCYDLSQSSLIIADVDSLSTALDYLVDCVQEILMTVAQLQSEQGRLSADMAGLIDRVCARAVCAFV
jgi:hypothetical protein